VLTNWKNVGSKVFLYSKRKEYKKAILRLVIINLPQSLFLLWMLFNKKYLGWYLWPFNLSFFSANSPFENIPNVIELLKVNFIDTGVWSLSLFVLGSLYILIFNSKFRKKFIQNKQALFCIYISLAPLIFFYYGAYLPRYTLFSLPFLILIAAYLIYEILSYKYLFGIMSLLFIISIFFVNWFTYKNEIFWAGEKNFEYLRIVRNHKETVDFVNKTFPDEKLIVNYPLIACFNMKIGGYFQKERIIYAEEIRENELIGFRGIVVFSDFFIRQKDKGRIGELLSNALPVVVINQGGINTKIYDFR